MYLKLRCKCLQAQVCLYFSVQEVACKLKRLHSFSIQDVACKLKLACNVHCKCLHAQSLLACSLHAIVDDVMCKRATFSLQNGTSHASNYTRNLDLTLRKGWCGEAVEVGRGYSLSWRGGQKHYRCEPLRVVRVSRAGQHE